MRLLMPLALLASFASLASAADLEHAIDAAVPAAVEARHHIHRNPELSNREFETAKYVAKRLKMLGYEVRTGLAKTGVVGILRGARPGPVVAARADMDALPVTEQTDFPFRSTRRSTYLGQEVGVAHACGHDVHTAVLLGTAEVLAAMKATLPGTVMLVFQPAEEGPPPGEEGGAPLMLKEGLFDDLKPAAMFALHAFPDWTVGQVAVTAGPVYASSDTVTIRIHGKQAHGAYPHLAVDPIVMAAQAVLMLQTIRSRNVPPREAAVVTIGAIHGGERFNIIPDAVELRGTVRTYSPDMQDLIERRMHEILDGVTKAGGGHYELDYHRENPPTVNHRGLSAWARGRLIAALGAEHVIDAEPTMGAEDFAWFAQEVPGFYFRLGTTRPGTESGGLHTPTFRADDAAIPVGIRAMTTLVLDFLNAPPEL
ncbi:MAG TPA: amidohydrolase [Gammaproteobacteria bacterium]|nr:amidohydrolase [Gammaproteobacteria bacterium]